MKRRGQMIVDALWRLLVLSSMLLTVGIARYLGWFVVARRNGQRDDCEVVGG